MRLSLAVICWLPLAWAIPAEADDASKTCFAPLVADIILGSYEATVSPLIMTIGGTRMIMAPQETSGADIVHTDLLDYKVTGISPDIPDFIIRELDQLEPDWEWPSGPRLMAAIPQLSEMPGPIPPKIQALVPGGIESLPAASRANLPGLARPLADVSSQDMDYLIGCSINDVPRLRGTFQTTSAEGVPVDFTVDLMLIGEGFLFGWLDFVAHPPQGPVAAERTITMTRLPPSDG